ncbi:MAG: polysaccharide deacetylase family protein [Nitrospinales bacterium]
MPKIAKWYQNKQAAISLRFDDSSKSHVKIAIPTLNRYGFLATFMVNPGRQEYQKYKSFWEKEVPAMGHRLGNHTFNHRGAKTLEEAEYEIGEVSRLIWSLYPEESKLNVFASGGGGKKWGGKYWGETSIEYKNLVDKYFLIDLYDGHHLSKMVNSSDTPQNLCELVNTVLSAGSHRPLHFHTIGEPTFKDPIKKVLSKQSLAVAQSTFSNFLDCLVQKKDVIWVAPIIDILKYQTEFKATTIEVTKINNYRIEMRLDINTDPELYDHLLTLIVPVHNGRKAVRLVQNDNEYEGYGNFPESTLFDFEPIKGFFTIHYQ